MLVHRQSKFVTTTKIIAKEEFSCTSNVSNMVNEIQVQGIVLTVAASLGILGNIPVIVSICQQRSLLKSSYYYLILHLAICDFLVLAFIIPEIYSIFSESPFIDSWSPILCKIYRPVHTVFFTAGAHFLLLISALRYRAVLHPLKPPIRRRTLKIMSTAVYACAITSMIPYVLVLRFDESFGCYEEWPLESLNLAYTAFLAALQYLIPVVILSVIYYKIGKEIFRQSNVFSILDARHQIQQQNAPKTRDLKPVFVSFTIVVCFIISGFPQQVVWITLATAPENITKNLPQYFHAANSVVLFGTIVLNPYIYGAMDKKVFSLFQRWRKKSRTRTAT